MNIETLILGTEIDPKEHLNANYIAARDDSVSEKEHEAHMAQLKDLSEKIPVPFFVTGNIRDFSTIQDWFASGASGILLAEDQSSWRPATEDCFGEGVVYSSMDDIPERKAAFTWADMKLNSDGMVPVVVQDYRTNQVLMVAYMNEESYNATLRTGHMVYYSRSRQELWEKGLTSGHFQFVKSLMLDCDNDTILAKVAQIGAACHTGSYSCFFRTILPEEFPQHKC